jgi:hypothetical protein
MHGGSLPLTLGVSDLSKQLGEFTQTTVQFPGKSLRISCLHQRLDNMAEMDDCAAKGRSLFQLCCYASDWSRLIIWNRRFHACHFQGAERESQLHTKVVGYL